MCRCVYMGLHSVCMHQSCTYRCVCGCICTCADVCTNVCVCTRCPLLQCLFSGHKAPQAFCPAGSQLETPPGQRRPGALVLPSAAQWRIHPALWGSARKGRGGEGRPGEERKKGPSVQQEAGVLRGQGAHSGAWRLACMRRRQIFGLPETQLQEPGGQSA